MWERNGGGDSLAGHNGCTGAPENVGIDRVSGHAKQDVHDCEPEIQASA